MTTPSPLSDILLQLSLIEDLGFPWHDVTTDLLFPDHHKISHAKIISKHPEIITVCGVTLIEALFKKLSPHTKMTIHHPDGSQLKPKETLLTIEAPASALLKGERVALNFLRHLSAIASLTNKYVEKIKHTQLKILDTRKTTPGMRELEKYAVHCGGGVNHRMGLYDAIMVKDTHVDILGGMKNALAALPDKTTHKLPVIIEIRTIEELHIALENTHKITRVLLDNMPPDLLFACVVLCNKQVETEASGNIRLENILAIAQTGVDYASVGELTYNAGQVDLSMYTS